jgi:hypothetical protein
VDADRDRLRLSPRLLLDRLGLRDEDLDREDGLREYRRRRVDEALLDEE